MIQDITFCNPSKLCLQKEYCRRYYKHYDYRFPVSMADFSSRIVDDYCTYFIENKSDVHDKTRAKNK